MTNIKRNNQISFNMLQRLVLLLAGILLPSYAQDFHCTQNVNWDPDLKEGKLSDVCRNAALKALREQENNFFNVLENSGFPSPSVYAKRPRDCEDIQKRNNSSGLYKIYPYGSRDGFLVYCDMESFDGGWTVFQRRLDGQVNFYRQWSDYRVGFGNISSEFWLGLEKINKITSQGKYQLLITMQHQSTEKYALYSNFFIGPEMTDYMLFVDDYSGDAGNSLSGHNQKKFTTKDRDNDDHSSNCATLFTGAWWYGSCHSSNLNGVYGAGSNKGPRWSTFSGDNPLTFAEMKMKKRDILD